MFVKTIALVCLLGVVAPPVARAADDRDVARVHFDAGKKFYDVGQYEFALKSFRSAYLAKADPVFLYNIAQCHRQLGQSQEAITYYKRYLAGSPEAPNRKEVEARISDLEQKLLATRPTTPVSPKPPEALDLRLRQPEQTPTTSPIISDSPHQAVRNSVLPWIAAGGTVALGGTTLASGLLARSRYNELRNSCGKTDLGCSQDSVDGLKTRALITNLLLGATIAAGVTTGILFYFDAKQGSAEAKIAMRF